MLLTWPLVSELECAGAVAALVRVLRLLGAGFLSSPDPDVLPIAEGSAVTEITQSYLWDESLTGQVTTRLQDKVHRAAVVGRSHGLISVTRGSPWYLELGSRSNTLYPLQPAESISSTENH